MSIPEDFVSNADTATFPERVLQRSHEVPVVVDFWAEWCQPCRIIGPVLEKLAQEADGAFDLVKVDVDANQELAAEFRVQGIPMVVAFRNGKVADTFTGALPEPAIREWVEGILPTALDLMVAQAKSMSLSGDDAAAEQILRMVLDETADHTEAGTNLAAILIEKGDIDEAVAVLDHLVPDSEVERLQSAARLKSAAGEDVSDLEAEVAANPADEEARITLAKALAARGDYEPALDHLLEIVRTKGPMTDPARIAVLDIFGVLDGNDPLVSTYRRQLATALF